jgi:hypothetical protein
MTITPEQRQKLLELHLELAAESKHIADALRIADPNHMLEGAALGSVIRKNERVAALLKRIGEIQGVK